MNIKNFFSSPGKKAFGLIALLVVVLGLGYGGYRRATNNPLLGDLQLIFQSQQVATPNNNLDFQAQPVEQKGAPQNQLQVQVNPNVGSTINVIPSGNIKGLPISDQSKVSVWLAAGQGMKYDGNKLIEWDDLSGNGRNVTSYASHAPQLSKQSGADCGDFNCQYGAYFDGVNDYMTGVKEVDKVQEMFVVVDLDGDGIKPIVNFTQHGKWGETYEIPTYWRTWEYLENSGLYLGYNLGNFFTLSLRYATWYMFQCVDGKDNTVGCEDSSGSSAYFFKLSALNYKYPTLVHIRRKDDGKVELWYNGRNVTPEFPEVTMPLINEKFFLGTRGENDPFSSSFFKGKIGEVIILNKNITDEESNNITAYLETKFGISHRGNSFGLENDEVGEFASKSPFVYPSVNGVELFSSPLNKIPLSAGYGNGIFGVGRLEENGLAVGMDSKSFSKSTQHQNFLSMGQVVGLDEGEFLYAGHDVNKNEKGRPIVPKTWSGEKTPLGAEIMTRKWQIEGKGEVESLVISAKLDPNAGENMLTQDKLTMTVGKPSNNQDYAIVFAVGTPFENSTTYSSKLRDDGKFGDLVANDNIYSVRINGEYLKAMNFYKKITLVRGPKGIFPEPEPDPVPDPGPNGPENILNPNLPQNPTGTLKVEVKTKDDKNTALNVGFDYNNGAVKHATPHTFNVDIATLNSEKRLKFDAKTDYLTPSDVTLNNYSVSNAPKNVQVTLNGNAMPFGTKFKDGDTLTLVGTYYNNANPPADTATINVSVNGPTGMTGANVTIDNNVANNVFIGNQGSKNFVVPADGQKDYLVTCQQVTGYDLTTNPNPIQVKDIAAGAVKNITCTYVVSGDGGGEPIDNAENKLTFRILSEDQQGNPLTENYSYNGESYAKTPAAFNKEYTDFVNLTKKVAYGPKAGYVTPGEVTIADRKITTLPKNVKLYLNGPNSVYTLGTQLNKEDTLFIVGTYIKSATITVGVEGPDGLPTVEVDIPGVVDNEPIPNGGEESFEVDPDGNYQVICPQINGYKLITDPNPFPVNNLNPGENEDVTCKYIDANNNDTTITVEVDGPNELKQVKVVIPGVTDGKNIKNDNSETFKVDPNKGYKVYCEEVNGYILLTKPNPIVVNPLTAGSNKNVKCEYVTNTGADEYDPNEDYDFFGNEESCLTYEERDLLFSDLQPNQFGYAAAEVLKNTAFSPKVTNSDIKKAVKNYPLSGFGSNISGNNQTQAEVRLPAQVIRADVTLLTMQLYCLPVFRGDSLPSNRLDGKPMPKVSDLPPVGTVAYDVIKTAFFYGILEGYRYEYPNNYVSWNVPITNWQFIKVVNNAEQNWQGYQNISDFNLARQYGFDTNDWVYTFVARAIRKNYPNSAILETPSLLRTTERNITRGEMVNHLFHSVIRDGLYYPQDEVEAWDAYQDLID